MSRTVSDSAGMLLAELRDALKKAFLLSFVKSGNTTVCDSHLKTLTRLRIRMQLDNTRVNRLLKQDTHVQVPWQLT